MHLKNITLPAGMDTLINAPGVYLFYGEQEIPLYIGKSIHVRQRVLSYFQTTHNNPKILRLVQQIKRVEWTPTAGELSALLLESELIKQWMPLYNRRLRRQKTLVGFQPIEEDGYLHIQTLRTINGINPLIYGAYRSERAAKHDLSLMVKEYGLCPKLSHLENSPHACFSYQLKHCQGACIQQEAPDTYNTRVKQAMASLAIETWPFAGETVIKETSALNHLTHYLVFDQWRHLGTFSCSERARKDLKTQGTENWDTYQILKRYLNEHPYRPLLNDHRLIRLNEPA